ncbi:hypothetical protein VI33_06545 [Methylophilales bacterium MBRS-H7]|uniref:Uncharacterized protein n=1 Tax=Methylophilales bacterium MBRS-H7 TaxID=1623450 RepID=A0A0H4JCU8_9PROT|nr:hypothetical protein VI33_06545 [Methylophilales bacterium MBRS-H7]
MHRAFRQQGRYQQQAYPIHQEIINDYQKLLPLMQEASLPDLDTYDKLMRYQTSLNNQLSKQIGELVELEKTYAK